MAKDDYTVEFHLKQAYGPFLNALVRLFIVSEKEVTENTDASGSYGEHGDYGKNYLVTHDAGSGAYQAVELVQRIISMPRSMMTGLWMGQRIRTRSIQADGNYRSDNRSYYGK